MQTSIWQSRSFLGRIVMGLVCLLVFGRPAHGDDIVPGEVLVRIRSGADILALSHDYNTVVRDHVSGTDLYGLQVPSRYSEAQFAQVLERDSRVIYAEPEPVMRAPEVGGDPFHLPFDRSASPSIYRNQQAYGQVNASAVGSPTRKIAHSSKVDVPVGQGGTGVAVAVLDTGVMQQHTALRSHLLPGYNALAPDLSPDEVLDGVTNEAMGHGTMVAGIIARVAPGARIIPVRVLNADGAGSMLDVAKGIYFALASGARVINMSFGTSLHSSAMNDALDAAELAGVIIVASAGNLGIEQEQVPAAGRGAISVASVEADNQKSTFSNYGSFVRVVAPGSDIQSTFWDGGYASWSGTSFASPFVSAEAALLISVRPSLTGDAVKEIIRHTATSVDSSNPSYRGKLGKGLINISAALSSLQ